MQRTLPQRPVYVSLLTFALLLPVVASCVRHKRSRCRASACSAQSDRTCLRDEQRRQERQQVLHRLHTNDAAGLAV